MRVVVVVLFLLVVVLVIVVVVVVVVIVGRTLLTQINSDFLQFLFSSSSYFRSSSQIRIYLADSLRHCGFAFSL